MPDEYIKYLSLDISKSLESLNKLEKRTIEAMGKIDDAYRKGAEKQTEARRNRESLEDAKQYYKDLEREYNNYLKREERLAREANKAEEKRNALSLKDAQQYYKDLEQKYRAYLKQEERLAEEAAREHERRAKEQARLTTDTANRMLDVYTNVMRRIVRVIAGAFRDAKAYVEEYDKMLTSITIVTGDSQGKAALGQKFENLAKELKVTSIEIGAAAEELYRQGLNDTEVIDRMKAITVYSKISGESFADSVEMITASVNSFAKEGEDSAKLTMRIVDVWSHLGDAVATSSSEIGIAMQKVAASGQAAGFTLEELSASIAVIESYTRAAAESVGTALNSMMARYMKVSSAGWGNFVTTDEGDVVRINDIAKAMESVGLSIVNAEGEFLNFSDVLMSLHAVWGDLSDAQKNYIATQMAGTRGLNYFLSLMNNYDEVLTLTAEAYDANGVAMGKYQIWTEGVEAAQNELSATLQDFFSNVLKSETLISFIEALTTLVGWLTNVTSAMDGANIKIGLFVAAALMCVSAIGKFISIGGSIKASLGAIVRGFVTSTSVINATGTAAAASAVAVTGLKAALMSIGVGLVITAITTLIGGLVSLADKAETTGEKINRLSGELAEIGEAMDANAQNIASINELGNRLEKLGEKTSYAKDELAEFNDIRAQLVEMAPDLAKLYGIEKDAVGELGDEYKNTADCIREVREELARNNWETANKGISTAIDTLNALDESGQEDWNNADFYRVPYEWATNVEDYTQYSNDAYEGYLNGTNDTLWEIEQTVKDHAELIKNYDSLISESWRGIFGEDIKFEPNQGLGAATDLIQAEIDALNAEYRTLDGTTEDGANRKIEIARRTEALNQYQKELEDYYDMRYNLMEHQLVFEEDLAKKMAEIETQKREAWDIIVRGSSNAPDIIDKYGLDTYEALLDTLAEMDFDAAGIETDKIADMVRKFFSEINDEIAFTMRDSNAEIDNIVKNEIPEGGITEEVIRRLVANDTNIESAVSEWTGGLVTSVETAADPYIRSWRETIRNLYTALMDGVADTTTMKQYKKLLDDSGFTQDTLDMITQAFGSADFNVDEFFGEIIGQGEQAVVDYLSGIVVDTEVEVEVGAGVDTTSAEKTFAQKLQAMISGFDQYIEMLELERKIKLGIELDTDDLMTIAKNAETYGVEVNDLSTKEGQEGAIGGITAAMLGQYGEEWQKYGMDVEAGASRAGDAISSLANEHKDLETLYAIRYKLENGGQLTADEIAFIQEKALAYNTTINDINTSSGAITTVIDIVTAMLNENGEAWLNALINAQSYGQYVEGLELAKMSQGYNDAVDKRDGMQTLYDGIYGMAHEGEDYDVSAMLEAYPQLIQYASNRNVLKEEAILLYNQEKVLHQGMLDQYGLEVKEQETLSAALNKYIRGANKAETASLKLKNGLQLTSDECIELMDEYPELTESLLDYSNGLISTEEIMRRLNAVSAASRRNELLQGLSETLAQLDEAKEGSYEATAALEQLGFMLTGGLGDMSSLEFAVSNLDLIRSAVEGDIDAFRRLAEAAVVHIQGSASVDFSALDNGLLSIENASAAVIEQLKKLGMFEIKTVTTKSLIVTQGENGEPITKLVTSTHEILTFPELGSSTFEPSGSNYSGGNSGGNSGGSNNNSGSYNSGPSDDVKNLLDGMDEDLDAKEYLLDIAKGWEAYYNATGELSKAIPYMEQQLKIYQDMYDMYMNNIEQLETLIDQKQTEIDTVKADIETYTQMRDQYKEGSDEWNKWNDKIIELEAELEGLEADQSALTSTLQEYKKAAIEAQKSIVLMTKAIEEQRNEIRNLKIDMQKVIYGYLKSIKDADKAKLNATVSMQDIILGVLKENARKEMELQKEVLENKKEALEEELDAIRRNFDEARALAEGNQNENTLAEKQRQLAAIMTDPTRAAERAALEKEIAELQSTIAWDTAEGVINEREEQIRSEINEIDREIERMEEAFAEIEEYSEEMMEEMYRIMELSNDEIIAWLKENSSEYANASLEGQQLMVDGWEDTLNEMKGVVEDIWGEIALLMAGGIEGIVELLKQTPEYLAASPEEQERMEQQLREQWNAFFKAETPPDEPDDPDDGNNPPDDPDDGENPPDDGGNSTVTATVAKKRYNMRKNHDLDADIVTVVPVGGSVEIDGYHGNWYHGKYKDDEGWIYNTAFDKAIDKSKLKQYAHGGLIDFTGPAWVDGTPGQPEAILSAAQTKMFERFVMMLEKWSMPEAGKESPNSALTVEGDIVVQVGGVNTDDDYENVGVKVMNAIYEKFKVRR